MGRHSEVVEKFRRRDGVCGKLNETSEKRRRTSATSTNGAGKTGKSGRPGPTIIEVHVVMFYLVLFCTASLLESFGLPDCSLLFSCDKFEYGQSCVAKTVSLYRVAAFV